MRTSAFAALLTLGLFSCGPANQTTESPVVQTVVEEVVEPVNLRFGLDFDAFRVVEHTVSQNEFFGAILQQYEVGSSLIHKAVEATEGIFDLRHLRPGHPIHLLFGKQNNDLNYMVYEKSVSDYVVFEFEEDVNVSIGEHPVEIREAEVSGTVESSLYEALIGAGTSPELSMEMADIYAWTVDFYRLQKGDAFRVVFDEEYIEDERVGTGEIKACWFRHGDKWLEAYAYEKDGRVSYYDWEGESLRKAFLKAPLKFSRISSRFTKKRFHPVLKRYKAHLGTDYAAPTGTPILAVGDGEVIKSERKGGNGNYVKIRHNSTYETQYLHMSKRAVKVGDRVTQGDVIGYVGSTGLATGPHVCFRFWKNGQQVDHLREDVPTADPLSPDEIASFQEANASLRTRLQKKGTSSYEF